MGPLSGFGPLVIGPNFIIGPMTSLGNIIVAPDSVGTCQDSEGGDDRHWSSPLLNGSHNWRLSCKCQWRLRYRIYRSALAPVEVSCFIGKTPALGSKQRAISAGNVVHAKLLTIAVAEIEFAQVAMQVLYRDAMETPYQAALQE